MTNPDSPKSFWRRWRPWFVGAALLAGLPVLAHQLVVSAGWGRTYFNAEEIPARDVAIVLGTSPKLRGKWSNPFFEARMNAAADLWKHGKVRHFLLSGDNGDKYYDEPSAMRDALISRSVPASAITLDYAGFRTLDSMARANKVFGQRQVTIITDDFHLPRSLFLARAHGMDAIGFGGQPVPLRWSKKTRLREIAARIGACVDVYVLHTKPKFLGPEVAIPTPNPQT